MDVIAFEKTNTIQNQVEKEMLLNSKLGTMAIEVEEKDPEGGDDDGDD